MTRRPTLARAQGSAQGGAPGPTSQRRPTPRPGGTRPAGGPRREARSEPSGSARTGSRTARSGNGGELARLLSVRALMLGVVLLVAFAMVFPTVRAYLGQRAMLTDLAIQVAAAEGREKTLAAQLDRWQTDAYVIAQARERLSYVMPGETAYRVIDPESVVDPGLVSTADPGSETGLALPVGGSVAPWYTTIWDSVRLAGEAPVPGDDSATPPDGATDGSSLGPQGDPAAGTAEDPAAGG